MSTTVVVRCETRPEAADDSQRLIGAVFDQLAVDDPGGLRCAVFGLADGVTFGRVAIVEGETDPLPLVSALAEFQRGLGDRMVGPPVPAAAMMLGRLPLRDAVAATRHTSEFRSPIRSVWVRPSI